MPSQSTTRSKSKPKDQRRDVMLVNDQMPSQSATRCHTSQSRETPAGGSRQDAGSTTQEDQSSPLDGKFQDPKLECVESMKVKGRGIYQKSGHNIRSREKSLITQRRFKLQPGRRSNLQDLHREKARNPDESEDIPTKSSHKSPRIQEAIPSPL